jgi:outer membrane putative beta-barrel porin/alpha-amylase
MRSHSRFVLTAVACVVVSATAASAQTVGSDVPPIGAGRPGSVENRGTLDAGVVQLEGGVSFGVNPDEEASPRNLTTPGGMLRFGLMKHVEARVGFDGFKYSSTSVEGARVGNHGTSDLYVGAKAIVLHEERAGFEFSVVPGLTLPTGSETLSSTGYDPSVTLAFARELPFRLDAISAWKFAAPTIDGDHHRELEGSVGVGRPLTSRIGIGGEVVRRATWEEAPVWGVGAGLAFRVAADVQADVQMGHDIRNGSGWTFGAGIVIRRR